MSNIHRALRVAGGHESGHRCSPWTLAAIAFFGAVAVLGMLVTVLVIGPGQ